jgi:hypothetical protein
MKKAVRKRIPILDLHFSAFQALHGNPPELVLNGTRVIFFFEPDEAFCQLSARYNSNEATPILDFVNAQRQLRAAMLSMKGQRLQGEEKHG